MTQINAPTAKSVLSTLNQDGSRIWMRPKRAHGRYLRRRQVVGYALILLFLALPFLTINEHPAILLDITTKRFHLFGIIFHPTDSALLMLLMLSIFLGIFWITALFGRVWCGWGCPQTVYLELIFRPVENLLEGGPGKQRHLDKHKGRLPHPRRVLKYVLFGVIAFILGNQFLSYFVGWTRLATWMTSSPFEHPEGFIVMSVTTALVFFDFAYFREQMCTVICPYARLQSALLDKHSLIVGYDNLRGEARKRLKARSLEDSSGDCIDCGACVTTCPTGIDIRDGLQLECIACTQCIDACDNVMDKIKKPRGLIRLSSQTSIDEKLPTRILRARTLVYPLLIVAILGLLVMTLRGRGTSDVTVLRQLNAPYVLSTTNDTERVRNQIRIKIVNRSKTPRTYTLQIPELENNTILAPQFPLRLKEGDSLTTPVFITLNRSSFKEGKREVTIIVQDELDFRFERSFSLLGPK